MYEPFFGLATRPFSSVPRVDQYFPADSIEQARQTLSRCIRRAEGPGMLIGPSGTGKTLLCLLLAEQFRTQFQTVVLPSGRLGTRRALLQAILYALGQPYRGMDEGESRLGLIDYLNSPKVGPAGMLLLVDEAHTLPLRLLDEIRMITNLVAGGQPRVRLVLAGGAVLEERFSSPKLESFSQRLVARCYLEPFNRTETEEYIHVQIDRAGASGSEIFPPETCQAVYQATDGVPRLINHVCDHVLLLAFAAGKSVIRPEHVQEAWADLQQLPTPWNSDGRRAQPAASVIEFGSLEEPAGQPHASPIPPQDGQRAEPATSCVGAATGEGPPARELAEQVQQIQTLVSGLDQQPRDFQPQGACEPEVELVFDDPARLLNEPFQQEEVISDRFSPAEQQAGGGRPDACLTPKGSLENQPAPEQTDMPPPGLRVSVQGPSAVQAGAAVAGMPLGHAVLAEPAPARPSPAPRPNQYRELFSRLRRKVQTS
ncbi:MAG: ExeA family protein [Thermoguttaceae bacterium]